MKTLYTIGYQGSDLTSFAAKVKEMPRIVDVRTKPYSRIPGFGRNVLQRHFAQYRWAPSLGGKTGKREDKWALGLAKLYERLDRWTEVVIFCMERDPAKCHRMWIVEDVLEHYTRRDDEIRVEHLYTDQPENPKRYVNLTKWTR